MKDALGTRMKENYEFRARTMLPRRTYTIIRLDGKAFHSYTRGLEKPFDMQLMEDLAATAQFLCEQIHGTRFAYTYSDEISLLLTDFTNAQTQPWYDGNVQKMTSVSASLATAKFNELRPGRLACFDARAFVIPDPVEVHNYFVWRQKDATRNSISMAAQAKFLHSALQGKSTDQMQELLWTNHGINWNDYDPRFKRGTVVLPITSIGDAKFVDTRTGEIRVTRDVQRRSWDITEAEIFTQDDQLWRRIQGEGK